MGTNKKYWKKSFKGDKRIFFCSYPRSGSVWYLTMMGEALGKTKHEMVYEEVIKIHERVHRKIARFVEGEKLFYLYRHPKDAILSYAYVIFHKREIKRLKNIGTDKKEIKGDEIRARFDNKILEKMLWEEAEEELLNIAWWKTMMEYYANPELRKYVDVLILRYEDIVYDPEEEVAKGLKFLGYEIEPDLRSHLTSLSTEVRLADHTYKFRKNPWWTKKIDDRVNKELGDCLEKYGYER